MPKIIEKRFFTAQDIRSLCIQKNWFTRGTNKQYDHLFSILFAHKVTNNKLYKAACLIEECSNPDNVSCDVTGIMYELNRICHVTYEIEE